MCRSNVIDVAQSCNVLAASTSKWAPGHEQVNLFVNTPNSVCVCVLNGPALYLKI